jgi:CheY-like chemotaxis protein
VQTARRVHPAAITLDVMMPGRDGWQVMQDLKNDPQTRAIPIIVCSLIQDEEKGFRMGATEYLVKPFLQDELLNALHRVNQAGETQQVLVIDDDMADLRLAEKMLSANPRIQISLAQGGQNGLALAKSQHPQAIILDLMMPDMDGFEVLNELRADPELVATPVIILSGADLTPEQHMKLTAMGEQLLAKAYLREKELLNTLEQALERIRPASVRS